MAEAEAEEEEDGEFSRRELIIESTKFAEFVSTLRILWNKDPPSFRFTSRRQKNASFILLGESTAREMICSSRAEDKVFRFPSSLGFTASSAIYKNVDIIDII